MGNEVTPLFFENMLRLYDVMESSSEIKEFDGVEYRVFIGALVELYDSLGLSRAHYTPMFSTLINEGCITRLQQGNRGFGSVIVLHSRPEESNFGGIRTERLTDRPRPATLSDRVELIEKRLGGLDIVQVLGNIEKRLKRVEKGEKKSGKAAS